MGVVHHAVYPVWFEAARVEFLEALGLPYHEVEAQGISFPVVALGVTYRAPARFGEEVSVHTALAEVTSRALLFRYGVEGPRGLLAEGFTRHLCQIGGKAARIPEALYRRLREAVP